jgi:hypothetical protein
MIWEAWKQRLRGFRVDIDDEGQVVGYYRGKMGGIRVERSGLVEEFG